MGESEGVSTRYLLGAFFAVVLLCAVFFSLGYFLGYREGRPGGAPLTQQVAALSDVPTPVNSSAAASSAAPPASAGQPSDTQAASEPTSLDQNAAAAAGNLPPQGAASSPSVSPTTTETKAPSTASGSAPADSEAAAPDEIASTARSLPSGLLIQVGAVRSQREASKVAETLRSAGYPALVLTPAQVGAKDSFFRVVAGPYKGHARAQAALKKLAKEGYRPFIRQ
jgi:DedD protein